MPPQTPLPHMDLHGLVDQFEELQRERRQIDGQVAETFKQARGLGIDPKALKTLRVADDVLCFDDRMLAHPPTADLAEPPHRTLPPTVLAVERAAIRERRAMEAAYQAFSSPEPRRRLVEPHALFFDGFRWHARARDADQDLFRDFVLGRLSEPALSEAATGEPGDDDAWNNCTRLEIAPHPDLPPHQRAAIAIDYGMTDERLILTPRAAVTWYVKRRLGLTEGHELRKAQDQHIVLVSEK